MVSVVVFNVSAIVVILAITLISSLFPVCVVENSSAESKWKILITRKLPFLTAGVFLGAGMLHLLPDAVETFDKLPMHSDYPLIYLLATIGCSIVWFVDLLNFGNSEKMLAVATAADARGASMCLVRIPSMATYGLQREQEHSKSTGETSNRSFYGACSFVDADNRPESPAHDLITKISHAGAAKMSLSQKNHDRIRSSTFDVDELLLEEGRDPLLDPQEDNNNHSCGRRRVETAAVSHHVVFSGDSPILPFLLAALFSVHSFIAGLALGVNPVVDKTAIATYVAILGHKFIEAMAVGANFVKENVELKKSVGVITLYGIMTPAGILCGMCLTRTFQGQTVLFVEAIVMAMAAGSFLYLSFHEMSDEAAVREVSTLEKVVFFTIGLTSMALLAYYV